jgi:Microtubule binding
MHSHFIATGELFQDVQPFVQSALDGHNTSVFAYGPSRSGKTHTMVCLFPFVACLYMSSLACNA